MVPIGACSARKAQVVALAAVVALSLTTAAGAGTSVQPTLRFVRLSPVTVRGAHFIPAETVRVTLRAGTVKRFRVTRTSAVGAFTVGFGFLRESDRCGTVMTLTAVGGQGDRSTYRLPPRECPTAATSRQDD